MRQYLKPEEVHAPSAAVMQEKKELRQDSKVCLHQGLVIAICQMFNDFSQLRKSVLKDEKKDSKRNGGAHSSKSGGKRQNLKVNTCNHWPLAGHLPVNTLSPWCHRTSSSLVAL